MKKLNVTECKILLEKEQARFDSSLKNGEMFSVLKPIRLRIRKLEKIIQALQQRQTADQ